MTNNPPSKPVIGIVGAVGSGKSTVARQFAELGCAIIDADDLAHQVLKTPPIIEKVSQLWGPAVLDPTGQIDRTALGDIVFSDPAALKKLTDLIHPLIRQQCQELLTTYQTTCSVKAIVLDAPLLLEAGWQEFCDLVVFVETDSKIRQKRLREAGRCENWAKKVENLQLALDIKDRISDHRVQNNSGVSELRSQVTRLFSLILGDRASGCGRGG